MTENTTPATVSDETIKEVVKARQKRPQKSTQMAPHVNPGDNSKYIKHALTFMKWGKPNMTKIDEVRQRVTDYFDVCEANDMKPSVESLALAFGVDRKTLWCWVQGAESDYIPKECRDMIKVAHTAINSMMADYMQNGKINPVSGIFLMKNNMGYADQSEVVITPNNPLGDAKNPEQIAQKYAELPAE